MAEIEGRSADYRPTLYWFDTEFIEDGRTIDLISIGVVSSDGREFYAEVSDIDLSRANEWVKENVLPHLWSRQPDKSEFNAWSRDGGVGGLLTRSEIARDLRRFVAEGAGKPEFWAYYGDYDWVALCQLYGRMIDLPEGWPMFALDLKQSCVEAGNPKLPEQTTTEHHALADARWTHMAWVWLKVLGEDDRRQSGSSRGNV
jgi:hypothetical protein